MWNSQAEVELQKSVKNFNFLKTIQAFSIETNEIFKNEKKLHLNLKLKKGESHKTLC